MILADTSVWIHHFRYGDSELADLLTSGLVLMHPVIMGELACGNLKNRTTILAELKELPFATSASDTEVLQLLEHHHLWGRGLGWLDAHLLASALLSNCRLWTLDVRLWRMAEELKTGANKGE